MSSNFFLKKEETSILAVRLLWNSLKYIKNATDKVKLEAINAKGWAIQFVENPTEEMQLKAVSKDYDSIKYIKNPSQEVQLAAIRKYWAAIKFINNPTLEARREASSSISSISSVNLSSKEKIFLYEIRT